jgi:microcompartment protein CcmK/EutM
LILGCVGGVVVATIKEPGFASLPLRIVRKVDRELVPYGPEFIAIDRIGVDDGQVVLLETSMEASMGLALKCGADAAIIAIVDRLTE